MRAKWVSKCIACLNSISPGDEIFPRGKHWVHASCAAGRTQEKPVVVETEEVQVISTATTAPAVFTQLPLFTKNK